MCRKEHVKPLIHSREAEDLVFQDIPHLKDEIEVSPVNSRWLFRAVVVHKLLVGGHFCFLRLVPLRFLGGFGRNLFFHIAEGVRLLCTGVMGVERVACRLWFSF